MNPSPLEVIGVVLGGLGFSLSLLLAYLSHFRPPEIELLPGGRIQFYPAPFQGPSGLVWGRAIGFYLPITFHNWSTRGGVVHKVRMVLRPKHDPERAYDMRWAEFQQMSPERHWIPRALAQPLPLEGQSSLTEMVQFQWVSDTGTLPIEPGEYEVDILGWTTPGPKPDLVHRTFTAITEQQAADYRSCLQKELAMTFEIPLGEERSWRKVARQADLDNEYGLS